MKEYTETLLGIYDEIRRHKTRLLEIQTCMIDEPDYKDEVMDEIFEQMDMALENVKENIEEIVYLIK